MKQKRYFHINPLITGSGNRRHARRRSFFFLRINPFHPHTHTHTYCTSRKGCGFADDDGKWTPGYLNAKTRKRNIVFTSLDKYARPISWLWLRRKGQIYRMFCCERPVWVDYIVMLMFRHTFNRTFPCPSSKCVKFSTKLNRRMCNSRKKLCALCIVCRLLKFSYWIVTFCIVVGVVFSLGTGERARMIWSQIYATYSLRSVVREHV